MDSERDAFSILEFCYRQGFSRAHYYNLKAAGKGPCEMDVLGRKLISKRAEADWQREREADAAGQAAA